MSPRQPTRPHGPLPVSLHPLGLAGLAFTAWTLGWQVAPAIVPGLPAALASAAGATVAGALATALVVRGVGREAASRDMGLPARTPALSPFATEPTEAPADPEIETRVALAGLVASASLAWGAIGSAVIAGVAWPGSWTPAALATVGLVAGGLGAMDLLPALPLAGGTVLRAWRWHRDGDVVSATRAAARWSRAVGAAALIAGLLAVAAGQWALGLGVSLAAAAAERATRRELAAAARHDAFGSAAVADLMSTHLLTLEADMTLREAIERVMLRAPYHAYPVVDGDAFVGLLTRRHALAIPPEHWPLLPVRAVMAKADPTCALPPDLPVRAAIRKLIAAEAGRLPVVDDGHVVGMLSHVDVERRLDRGMGRET